MITVTLETGPKRTFASAVDWPGWCRVATGGPAAALDALAAYAPRYARVAARAGLALPTDAGETLDAVETVEGGMTTDFGAPGEVSPSDRAPLDAAGARRLTALLAACWDELDAVAATSPAELRKGPRGGGRDRDAMVAHVVDAERSYARKVGVRMTAAEWKEGGVPLLHARLRAALDKPWDGGDATGDGGGGWPPRYLIRRAAWHVLDHAWEMEDRGHE